METSMIITSVVVSALIILPFIFMALTGNKTAKLLDKNLADICAKENMQPQNMVKFNNSVGVYDQLAGKFAFLHHNGKEVVTNVINVKKMKAAKLIHPEIHKGLVLPQKSVYFQFTGNENNSEQKVYLYHSTEHKPVLLEEIVGKAQQWDAMIQRSLNGVLLLK